jgi:type VI secretion system protein VasG
VESGARNVDNILTNTLLPDLSRMLLSEIVEGRKPERIQVVVGADSGFEYEVDTPKPVELEVPVISA